MKIYVGNLPYSATEDGLQAAFGEHGDVEEVNIPADRNTGRSRGFGFVTMPNDEEAKAAIAALNETELDGRAIRVSEARPRSDDRGHGGGGRGGRGGGGGGGRRW